MGKRLVGLRHAVHLVFLFNSVALILGGQEEFCGELLCHRLPLLRARGANNPAE